MKGDKIKPFNTTTVHEVKRTVNLDGREAEVFKCGRICPKFYSIMSQDEKVTCEVCAAAK